MQPFEVSTTHVLQWSCLHLAPGQHAIPFHRRQNPELRVSSHRKHHTRQRQLDSEANPSRDLRSQPKQGSRSIEDPTPHQPNPMQKTQRPAHYQTSLMSTSQSIKRHRRNHKGKEDKPTNPRHHRKQPQGPQKSLHPRRDPFQSTVESAPS